MEVERHLDLEKVGSQNQRNNICMYSKQLRIVEKEKYNGRLRSWYEDYHS